MGTICIKVEIQDGRHISKMESEKMSNTFFVSFGSHPTKKSIFARIYMKFSRNDIREHTYV